MGLFRTRQVMGAGSVLFRGTLPPRAEEFEYLRAVGIEVERASPRDAHWSLDLRHPEWGEATLVCLRETPPPPAALVDYSVGMTRKEKEQVKAGRSLVSVTINGRTGAVLWDLNCLL